MSNETKTKHLPGSWEGGLENHVLFTHGLNIPPSTVMRIITEEEYQWGKKCVNAMEAIEDPEGWMKDIIERLADDDHEIFELQKYKTACESINKYNPMVVSDNLGDIVDNLRSIIDGRAFDKESGLILQHRLEHIQELINKIELPVI